MISAAVHLGQAAELYERRRQVLQVAYEAHPERFVQGRPLPPALPTAVWINPPLASVPTEPLQTLELPSVSSPNLSIKVSHLV